ncbi:MAG: TRAP transporter large permease [Gemmatimonadetes bacterium]|nr:TRAP transporter large permease [Gemmatimonadota bacterium]MCY3676419.1 TRAP transporter large permease [Gemmatimonadota bacterium]MYA43884.1 TRAP transporter large permease [Gemmatimonadota bacterium]MYE94306.1 TRAP transporter large permease [Gemmatimonadota bacterium]MYJ10013.1 TRAP transporter large permease [Gemmatimonadota bacterium]
MMDGTGVALLGFLALLALLLIRMPVGLAMLVVGVAGIALIRPGAVVPVLAGEVFAVASRYSLTILPLFMLMGNLAVVSGMSQDLYRAAHAWLGRVRGSLASASIVACAGFSALSGSSLAAALTMGRVSLPEMRRFGYDDSLATGAIAAGGTLGFLIPPSAGLVIYGIITEESIGRLFMAGVLPGILLTLLFVLAVWIIVRRDPGKAPHASERVPWRDRLGATAKASWIMVIVVVTIGGIYAGVFSAIEAAGVGALLTLVAACVRRALNRETVPEVVRATLKASGTAFLVLFGAFVFKVFLGLTGVAFAAADWVGEQGYSGAQVVMLVLVMFIVLGTFLDGFAMLVLTVPLVQPILESLGVDMIWFGVMIVITLEMGLISPPVGLNIFVVKGVAPDVPVYRMFRGIIPFWFAMLAALILIALFPRLATLLPNAMYG